MPDGPGSVRARVFGAVVFGAWVGLSTLPGCGEDPPPIVEDLGLVLPEFSPESAALSAPPRREGNEVQLLVNGEASLAARLKLIAEAKRSIYLQALIFKADTSGRAIADALIARKRQDPSLDVRVIVDAYSNIQDTAAQLMYFELQSAGVNVEGFEAFYLHWFSELSVTDWLAHNMRYHEKYLVIDGERAVVGGMNVADEYFRCSKDPFLTWRDQDVAVSGPAAADVSAAFLDNHGWFKAAKALKPALLNPDTYWSQWQKRHPAIDAVMQRALDAQRARHARKAGVDQGEPCTGTPVPTVVHADVPVRFVRNRPRAGERLIRDLYLEQIAAAEQSVLIENAYFVPSDALMAALVSAAKRGVDVHIVTNSDKTNDIPMITVAGRARYKALLDAGVHVYEWHAERFGEGTIHAKHAVFDDRVAIIGSYNLDPRSERLNSENVVLLEHAPIAAELAAWIREHDLPMAEAITPEQAVGWLAPGEQAKLDGKVPLWSDPRFDPKSFEYLLVRGLEGNL